MKPRSAGRAVHAIELGRTTSPDPGFVRLVGLLDEELDRRYPEKRHLGSPDNRVDSDAHVVLALCDGELAGCGCFRSTSVERCVEIKRMYVVEEARGKGVATAVLRELERWAVELGSDRAILETGVAQPEAIALYRKSGYRTIGNYGPYVGRSESVCLAKDLAAPGIRPEP